MSGIGLDPAVSFMEEIEELDQVAGGSEGGWLTTLVGGAFPCLVSVVLGNTDQICTWTYECQNNCR